MDYPAQRFIRVTIVDGAMVPAFAPQPENDALAAYAPFLYLTMEAGAAELDDDIESRKAEIAANPEAFDMGDDEEGDELYDGYYADDSVLSCTVNEDGSIELDGTPVLTRERVFSVYGVQDVSTTKPKI